MNYSLQNIKSTVTFHRVLHFQGLCRVTFNFRGCDVGSPGEKQPSHYRAEETKINRKTGDNNLRLETM